MSSPIAWNARTVIGIPSNDTKIHSNWPSGVWGVMKPYPGIRKERDRGKILMIAWQANSLNTLAKKS